MRGGSAPKPNEPVPPLSLREIEVVRLVVEGLTNREIAEALQISPRTVQTHLASAARKAGTATRTQLAVLALRRGWAPMEPALER